MKKFIQRNSKLLSGLAALLLIGGITMSFQDSPFVNQQFSLQQQSANDTIPDRDNERPMKMKEFDKLITDLDKNLLNVAEELKKMDFSKIHQQAELALQNVDLEKIMKEVEASIKNIDLEKIMKEVETSLKNVDWEKHEVEMKKALEEAKVELDKAKIELKEIDMQSLKDEMAKAKQEIEKSKIELSKIDMDEIMKEAKEGIEKGKEELRLIRTMFTEMEKDGLISTKDGFTVEYKDKALFINGKQQSEQTTDKYRKYFKEDHFKIRIEKD